MNTAASPPVPPQLPSLDHVGFVGGDLLRLIGAMQRLGFATTEPQMLMRRDAATGAAVSLRQQSCHAVFASGYIELSAVLTDDPSHHLAAYRQRGEGLHILALGSRDPDADWHRCTAAGLPCSVPAGASRQIDYGARRGEARFRWFMLGPEAAPEGLLCLVRNETPELVFQPEVIRHDNGVVALCEVVVQAESPPATAARLGRAAGVVPRAIDVEAGQAWAMDLAGGAALSVLSPVALEARFGAAAIAGAPPGRFAALQLRVARLEDTVRLLQSRGIPCERRAAELVVPAASACGAVLAFRE